jgi:hypothetical protein
MSVKCIGLVIVNVKKGDEMSVDKKLQDKLFMDQGFPNMSETFLH